MDRRGSTNLAFLVFVLASLAVASMTHVALGLLDAAGLGSDAYGTYTHTAVVPIAFAALALAGALVLIAVAKGVARRGNVDPVTALLRSVGSRSTAALTIAVTAGGTVSLVAMEFFEQSQSLGHIASLATSLGGVPIVGVAVVAAMAFVVVVVGLAALRFVVGTAVNAAIVLVAWVVAAERAGTQRTIVVSRPPFLRVAAFACAAQNLGSRPPPVLV
jgi:hypothetical protein